MSNFSFDELMGSLQAHEAMLNRSTEKHEEKAFQVKREASYSREFDKAAARRGRGRGEFHGKSRGRGRGRVFEKRHSTNEQKGNKSGIQCYHCKKFGHVKEDS